MSFLKNALGLREGAKKLPSRAELIYGMKSLLPAFWIWLAAASWLTLFSLGGSSLLAYSLFAAGSKFADVSEQAVTQKLPIFGMGAIMIPLALLALQPLSTTGRAELWPRTGAWKRLSPGLLEGIGVATLVCFALVASGFYEVQGFLPRSEDWSIEIGGFLLRFFAMIGISYATSLVSFELMPRALAQDDSEPHTARRPRNLLFCALGFSLLIRLGFDLGWAQLGTFLLIGLYGALRSLNDDHFLGVAGFLTGLLFTVHLIFGLSALGVENQGIFSLRYMGPNTGELESALVRWITGGYGGPLSGLVTGGALTVQIAREAATARLFPDSLRLRLFPTSR